MALLLIPFRWIHDDSQIIQAPALVSGPLALEEVAGEFQRQRRRRVGERVFQVIGAVAEEAVTERPHGDRKWSSPRL